MKVQIVRLLQHHQQLFYAFIVVDIVIVLLHLLLGNSNVFFHLDFEQNLPTFYQSFKLIGFGALFVLLGMSKQVKLEIKSFILPLGLFLAFLGIDELFQVHENIYRIFEIFDWLHPSRIVEASMRLGYRSSLWILYYLPFIFLFVFWCGYWLRYFQSKMKSNFGIIGLSSLCFFAVLLAEILSSTGSYSDGIYFWLITLEETAEMLLGSTLILVGCKTLQRYFR